MISLAELTTPLTKEQVTTSIYQVLASLGVNTTTWKPGAVVRAMITAVAIVASAFTQLTSSIAKGGFLDLATGAWLDLVSHYVYGVDRNLATFATGEITFTNSSGSTYLLDPDDIVVSNPDTGKTYRVPVDFTINAMSSVTVPIVAIEAGSGSTSIPGTIVELETPLIGVTCTNALAVIGSDDELDPALRARCREKLGSLSPFGPWDAYTFAAKNAVRATDGTKIGVNRVRTVKDGFGNVTVYVATATGAVSGSFDDPLTDLGAVEEAIQRRAAPLAVTAITVSAADLVVPVTYEVWAYNTAGLTADQWEDEIALAIANFVSSQPIGGNVINPDLGKLFVDGLRRAIGAVRSEIFRVVVTAPAADVVLNANQVSVLGTVNAVAIHEVAPPEGF